MDKYNLQLRARTVLASGDRASSANMLYCGRNDQIITLVEDL